MSIFGIWDGLELMDGKGRALLALFIKVVDPDDAPDSAHQELVKLLDCGAGDLHPFVSQVGEKGLVSVPRVLPWNVFFLWLRPSSGFLSGPGFQPVFEKGSWSPKRGRYEGGSQ
jgi:hypothetical protein